MNGERERAADVGARGAAPVVRRRRRRLAAPRASAAGLALVLCGGGLLLPAPAATAGSSDDAGTTATAVTRLGIGARPTALGHAYAAVGGDATTLITNPAGLASVSTVELDLHHQQRFADTHVSTFNLALPAGPAVVGIGAGYLDEGEIDEVVDFVATGAEARSSDLDVMLGAAVPLYGGRLRAGGRLDLLRRVLADRYDDFGAAVALGAQVPGLYRRLDLGVTVQSLGDEQSLDDTRHRSPLPRTVRGGAALTVLERAAGAAGGTGVSVLAVGDVWQARGSRAQWGIGGELALAGIAGSPVALAGRLGYRSGGAEADQLRNLTAGLGLDLGFVAIDYSFEDGDLLGDVHRVTLGLVRRPAPTAAPPPPDSDGDGVDDARDLCPDTRRGVLVDARGCAVDSDGDGVPDGLDQCPDTPQGVVVGRAGCPMDSDFDGVFDGLDRCPGTTFGTRVDASGCPVAPPPLPRLDFEPVRFEFDRSTIRDRDLEHLLAVGRALEQWPQLRLRIAGHADAVGPERYNERLSMVRARAVAEHLLERFPSIRAERLEVVGYGETVPVSTNATPEGRSENRRVSFVPLNGEQVEKEPRGGEEREDR